MASYGLRSPEAISARKITITPVDELCDCGHYLHIQSGGIACEDGRHTRLYQHLLECDTCIYETILEPPKASRAGLIQRVVEGWRHVQIVGGQ